MHTEYLAKLGEGRFFACVDLADISGDVYDVDFFLEGPTNAMRVTETTVHKLNGKPFYLWEQNDEGNWVHVEVTDGSNELLGVLEGVDEFEFQYRARLPAFTKQKRACGFLFLNPTCFKPSKSFL